jgi:phosphatidate cytidylyltransferase
VGLLVFFVVLVQVSDLLHFLWDRLVGKHIIAPKINATKTWEGLIGSACCTAIFSMMIHLFLEITPFTFLGAGCMGLLVSVMASSGSMTMSAIKRDRGVHDFGTLIQGHAGVLDRIDSICFAAPIFFHVTRFFLNRPPSSQPVESATVALADIVGTAAAWFG